MGLKELWYLHWHPKQHTQSRGYLMPPRGPRWKVPLAGEESDLNLLATHFSAREARVAEEDGNFFVSASAFEPIDDGRAVVKRAAELVERLHQAMSLKGGRPLGNVSVVTSTHESSDQEHPRITHYLETEVTLALRSTWSISSVPQAIPPSPPDPLPAALIKLATTNRWMAQILEYWSSELDFAALYKILELIEKGAGKPVDQMGWCTRNQRGRFTVTANDPRVGGDHARHAVPPSGSQWRGKPMTIGEARVFIRRMVRLLAEHLTEQARKLPRSIGMGDSGIPDLADRYEEDMDGFGEEGLEDHYAARERAES